MFNFPQKDRICYEILIYGCNLPAITWKLPLSRKTWTGSIKSIQFCDLLQFNVTYSDFVNVISFLDLLKAFDALSRSCCHLTCVLYLVAAIRPGELGGVSRMVLVSELPALSLYAPVAATHRPRLNDLAIITHWPPREVIVINTLRPRQNGRHFADDTFKRIFMNENVRISIKISLMFVPKGSINNIPALVQIMAWRRPGDKPLSEPLMDNLPTHICVTRPQWVKKDIIQINYYNQYQEYICRECIDMSITGSYCEWLNINLVILVWYMYIFKQTCTLARS